jgi:hypothetical protein
MPRTDRHAAAVQRPGPYEHAYDVRRGYDAPLRSVLRAAPVPVMVASHRDDREDDGRRWRLD